MSIFSRLKQAIKQVTKPILEVLKSVSPEVITGKKAKKVKSEWEKRKAKEEAERIRKEYYEQADRTPTEDYTQTYTDAILQGIENKINQYKDSYVESYAYGARLLEKTLDREIATSGRAKVARACENSPSEAIHASDVVIFASRQEQKESGIMQFIFIITGTVLTPDSAKDLGRVMDEEDSGYIANQSDREYYE